ncbi:MAG: HAD hydrolase-like protein [Erysipelotrichaceae bacterium]|nr:HAD hydrolase-like protein [Erysipelotrichaceae bacterium]
MKRLRYKCMILDHDDTTVNSTASIHFPSFLITMKELRPESDDLKMTLKDYYEINCNPGIFSYYKDVACFSKQELQYEFETWKDYVSQHTPSVYEGMKELICDFMNAGGILCVVSHNHVENILRDYDYNKLPHPSCVYGCEYPEEMRKPSVKIIDDICDRFHVTKKEILLLDDLVPGFEMAVNGGVDYVVARWAHEASGVTEFVKNHNSHCAYKPEELRKYLFEEDEC